jgi:hypothetical protein
MFALSSYVFSYISISLLRCVESNLTTRDRNTKRQLYTHPLLEDLLAQVMSHLSLRGTAQ